MWMAEKETRTHNSGSAELVLRLDPKVEVGDSPEEPFSESGLIDPLRRRADSEIISRSSEDPCYVCRD
jgi:hypothetical protein